MDTLLKFERVILTKEMDDRFKLVGEVFEVASILNDAFLLRDAKKRIAVGVISFVDFEKYFVREDKFKGWTKWQSLRDEKGEIFYKTNRKKVMIKSADGIRAEACCCKDDEFSLYTGIQIAYARWNLKVLEKEKAKYENALKEIREDISYHKNVINGVINSLDKVVEQ